MYMAVWPGHQKMNLKCGKILNQEVRRILLYVQKKQSSHTDDNTMKSVTSI